VSVSQINLLFGTMLASFLPTGSVSWLYYSDRLSELRLGVFAVAIGTVLLPSLSRNQAQADTGKFSRTLDWALRMVLLVGMPASMALFAIGHSIQIALFQYRETTPFDVRMSSYALMAIATGLSAFMLIKVLAPAFYARQDMRTPVRIGIIAMVANMVLNLLLVVPLHMTLKLGHVGLALATALAAWLHAGLLARGLLRQGVFVPQPGWGRFWLQLGSATLALGAVLWLLDPALGRWLQWSWWERLTVLTGLCAAGFATYVGVLYALGVRVRQLRGPAGGSARSRSEVCGIIAGPFIPGHHLSHGIDPRFAQSAPAPSRLRRHGRRCRWRASRTSGGAEDADRQRLRARPADHGDRVRTAAARVFRAAEGAAAADDVPREIPRLARARHRSRAAHAFQRSPARCRGGCVRAHHAGR